MHNQNFREQFVAFAVAQGALCFGEFTTKAGRRSPYFFNSGLFNNGEALSGLCRFYAEAAIASGIEFDLLFGPAYKGIPLVAGIAIELARMGHNKPFCFNRKEAKDHGEGGLLVGAPLKGRVLIVDDVITDGASKRESVELIRQAGATPVGVVIALDRQERGSDEANAQSAAQAFAAAYGVPVFSVATLEHILAWIERVPDSAVWRQHLDSIRVYRQRYGVTA